MNFKKIFLGLTTCSLCSFIGFFTTTAFAGGFSIREQSTSSQGASFAGNAAGSDLSTIFWNPAGVTIAGPGITTESHAAVLIPDAEIDPTDAQALVGGFGLSGAPNDIDKVALVPSSYGAWRINEQITVGFGFNAPFGLASEADNQIWSGQYDFQEAELKTFNFNPVIGYQMSPTFSVGVGLQVQYADLNVRQAIVPPFIAPANTHPTAEVDTDDWSYGFTLGFLWRPQDGTSIGVGYRSRLNNTFEGDLTVAGLPALSRQIELDLDLPEIVTVSLRQDLSSNLRLLGTFEWTNWSILGDVVVFDRNTGGTVPTLDVANLPATTPLQIEANWDDGYFLAGGLEYDYSNQLTLRGGVAYEWSPVQNPAQRLLSVPDSDRIWLSAGATYKWTEATSFDFAYTHIFFDDENIVRPTGFTGSVESSTDIISVSYKTKWGQDGPLGLLSGLNN